MGKGHCKTQHLLRCKHSQLNPEIYGLSLILDFILEQGKSPCEKLQVNLGSFCGCLKASLIFILHCTGLKFQAP